MKLQVSITRSGVLTNQAPFSSMEEAQAWVDSHVGIGSFGSPRYAMQSVEIAPAVIDQEELLDSEGLSFDPPQFQDVEISPAQFEDQLVEVNPDGYDISIGDVSAQADQQVINSEALKYLAETDWMVIRESEGGVACSQEIKDLRAAARLSIVR